MEWHNSNKKAIIRNVLNCLARLKTNSKWIFCNVPATIFFSIHIFMRIGEWFPSSHPSLLTLRVNKVDLWYDRQPMLQNIFFLEKKKRKTARKKAGLFLIASLYVVRPLHSFPTNVMYRMKLSRNNRKRKRNKRKKNRHRCKVWLTYWIRMIFILSKQIII